MVPRPNQGGDSIYTFCRGSPYANVYFPQEEDDTTSWATCAHNGDFARDREFDSNVFYFLILIMACLTLFSHTIHLVLLSLCDGW